MKLVKLLLESFVVSLQQHYLNPILFQLIVSMIEHGLQPLLILG